MQIGENVFHRGLQPRWITLAILLALHNSLHHTKAEFNNVFIIDSKYFYVLNKLTFSLTSGLFLGSVSGCYRCFSLQILLKKLMTYVLPILAFILCSSSLDGNSAILRLRITVNALKRG